MQDLIEKAGLVKMLVLDVDGILSNGQIIYDANGIETKALSVMNENAISQLLVIDEEGRLEAIITVHDLLQAGVT